MTKNILIIEDDKKMIPFFLVIAVAIPYYQYRKMSRESIVERIRGE